MPGRDPIIKIEVITPAMAAQMLGTSAGNRSIRKSAVNRYARDMVAGKWVLNGEAIKFDVTGRLVDGHHRLSAVIAAQRPITVLVIRNVQPDAMLTLDTGVGRSFHDASIVAGKTYDSRVGPIARWWYKYTLDKMTFGGQASHQEIEQVVEDHQTILESARYINRLKSVCKYCTPSAQGFVHAYASEKYDREMADVFMRDLNDGAKLDEFSPIFVLRRALVEDDRTIEPYRVLAFTIKAWNLWIEGAKCKVIHWRNSGPKPEPFPKFSCDVEKVTASQRRSRAMTEQRIALVRQRKAASV